MGERSRLIPKPVLRELQDTLFYNGKSYQRFFIWSMTIEGPTEIYSTKKKQSMNKQIASLK